MRTIHIHWHTNDGQSKGRWVTISGAHVFVDGDGEITKGPDALVEHHASKRGELHAIAAQKSGKGFRVDVKRHGDFHSAYVGAEVHEHEESAIAEGKRKLGIKPELAPGKETPTGKLFSHAPIAPPKQGKVLAKPEEKEVSVHLLIPTQPEVMNHGVRKYKAGEGQFQKQQPEVVRMKNGRYALLDGHHRAAAAIMANKQTVKVRIMEDE